MKKLYLLFVMSLLCLFSGCSTEAIKDTINEYTQPDSQKEQEPIYDEETNLMWIRDCFWYDIDTKIVYYWNGHLDIPTSTISTNAQTTPSAYFAPNGKPYLYNPETGLLEENN